MDVSTYYNYDHFLHAILEAAHYERFRDRLTALAAVNSVGPEKIIGVATNVVNQSFVYRKNVLIHTRSPAGLNNGSSYSDTVSLVGIK